MSDRDPQHILAHLRRQQPAMVELLRRLALAESPSGNRAAVDGVLRLLTAELEGAGMRVRRFRGRQQGDFLLARLLDGARHNEEEALQLLVGHCDTVWPVGTVERMPVAVEGDCLKGPGVFDMKGGLVQLLFALRAARDLQLDLPAVPVAVINSDEEIGSKDSTPLIRGLARRAARAFVLEPAFGKAGQLKTARKAVGSFEVIISGQAAHAGVNPEEGVSAILEMSYQIQRLFALNDAARGVTVNVGTVDGGLRPNVVAPEVRASVDVRVPTREDALRVEAAIRGLQPVNPLTAVRVEGGFDNLPMERSPRNQALWQLARELGRRLGLELEQAAVGGASDGNTTSLYTATLDGLGAVGDGAHALHEQVEIARLPERAALLVLLLAAPLGASDHVYHP
ncbi:MAG: M20 family metallopeptidase [Gemmataceae bacterium]|nr:M20 family metallopeptidase [Gemmataceae bacterium]